MSKDGKDTREIQALESYNVCVNPILLLLLLLSRVRLCATPYTAAHQAPPSLGFSRQEQWSGVPLPSQRYNTTDKIIQNLLEFWGGFITLKRESIR